MICSWCNNEIHPYDQYLQVGDQHICKDCVENGMEEYDPEGDEIDLRVNETIERRLGIA